MRYSVELEESVAKTVAGWNLPSRLQREVLNRLDELGPNPTRYLTRLQAPSDCLVFQFTARDPAGLKDYLFSFSFVYRDDEQTLLAFDCDLLVLDDEPDPPPGS
jgi:hypothetical protein